jgi:hypothetical protein
MMRIKVIKLNATDTLGSRIKATMFVEENKTFISNTIPYPYELSGSSVFVWGAESMLLAYTMKGSELKEDHVYRGSLWDYLRKHGIYLTDDEKRTFMIPTKKGYDIVTDIDCDFLDNVNEKKTFKFTNKEKIKL